MSGRIQPQQLLGSELLCHHIPTWMAGSYWEFLIRKHLASHPFMAPQGALDDEARKHVLPPRVQKCLRRVHRREERLSVNVTAAVRTYADTFDYTASERGFILDPDYLAVASRATVRRALWEWREAIPRAQSKSKKSSIASAPSVATVTHKWSYDMLRYRASPVVLLFRKGDASP